MTRRARHVVVVALAALTLTACATTVVEDHPSAAPDASAGPTTTLPLVGTTAELLAEMRVQMTGLSAQIAADGDERATLARIEAIWDFTRADVEATHPDLVAGIDTTIEMAGTAVRRIRPADADKATQLLTELISRYRA